MKITSSIARLRAKYDDLVLRLVSLQSKVGLRHFDRSAGGLLMVCPEWYWEDLSSDQKAVQFQLKREYETWFELLKSVFRQAPDEIGRTITSANEQFRIWLEFGSNWGLSGDLRETQKEFENRCDEFREVLAVFAEPPDSDIIVAPDTNMLVAHPDPVAYRTLLNQKSFTFLLMPTVLGELDTLKNNHRNPDFREKVLSVIQRIKGWRNQGSLLEGIKVDKTITVQSVATEPKMSEAPSWLDSEMGDDRFIASILELQAARPTSSVLLITGDINMLNKTEHAGILATDFP